jgi:hypothetical protein
MMMIMEHWWKDTDKWKPNYTENSLPLLILSTTKTHVLAWDRIRPSAVKGQQSRAMTRFPVNSGASTFLPNGFPFSK